MDKNAELTKDSAEIKLKRKKEQEVCSQEMYKEAKQDINGRRNTKQSSKQQDI